MKRNQRFTIYCILLHELETARLFADYPYTNVYTMVNDQCCGGMCDILMETFNTVYSGGAMHELDLMELLAKKPNVNGVWWFPRTVDGWKQRIELVKKCIKQTS